MEQGVGPMGSERRETLGARVSCGWRAATAPALLLVWGGWCLWVVLLAMPDLGRTRCFFPTSLAVFDVGGEVVVAEWGDDVCAALEGEGRPYELVWYGRRGVPVGFPFPAWVTRIEEIRCPVADAERGAVVRAAAFDHLVSIGYAPSPGLRSGDLYRSGVMWSGCGLNLATLFAACAFVGSVRRLPELWVDKRAKQIAAGICPSCGYSIAGLPTDVCPECGEGIE